MLRWDTKIHRLGLVEKIAWLVTIVMWGGGWGSRDDSPSTCLLLAPLTQRKRTMRDSLDLRIKFRITCGAVNGVGKGRRTREWEKAV